MSGIHDPTLRAYRRALAAEGAFLGALFGGACAAAAVLAVRALAHPAPAWTPALVLAVPFASIAGALLNLRRTPSRGACAALTEDATHAGGLLLVGDLPGAEAWPRPAPVAAEVPGRIRRHLPKCIPVAAALAFAFAAPAGWFAAATPPAATRKFPDVTADLRNALDDVREEELLDPATAEELAEELKRIEASADPSDPGAALDAADRLRERMAALLELNDASLKRVSKDKDALAQVAADPEAAKEFEKMLEESGAGSCPNGEERPGAPGEGEGEKMGAGAGEPERGRGDAKMSWGNPAQLGDSNYKDTPTEAKPGDNPDEEKVGESISQEDPAANAPLAERGASAAPGGRPAGASVSRSVAPRHRGTVKRFFDTERKDK